MRILDTDMLSHVFDGNSRALQRLRGASDDVYTTVISQIEMLQARHAFVLKAADGQHLLRAQEWLDRTIASLERFPALPIDEVVASRFDSLRAIRRLRKVGRGDLLIASIALAHAAVLVTRNIRDFALVPGLKVENWLD